MLDYMDLDHCDSVFFLVGLEFSHDESLLRPSSTPTRRDMLLGAGGSALAHIFVAIAALLLPFIQAPRELQGTFVTVSLVEMGEMGAGSCSAGGVQDSDQPKPFGEPSLREIKPETVPAPPTPKVAQRVERIASAEKGPRKPRTPPITKQGLGPPGSPSTDSIETAPSSSEEPASQPPGTASDGEQTSGSNRGGGEEAGKSSGTAATGGSGLGMGSHGGEFDAAAVDQIPQVVRKIEPDYPPRARRQGVCGRVVMKFLVGIDGRVSRPSIIEARPQGYFEQSALEAIVHWRFQPGYYRGKAVATWVILPVQFKLTG
jgi:periplasmic protein TonB